MRSTDCCNLVWNGSNICDDLGKGKAVTVHAKKADGAVKVYSISS
jgi:hypothetical protein